MERNSEKKDGGAGGAGEDRKLARVGMSWREASAGSAASTCAIRTSEITAEDRISVSIEGGVVGRVRVVGAVVAVRRKHDCDEITFKVKAQRLGIGTRSGGQQVNIYDVVPAKEINILGVT